MSKGERDLETLAVFVHGILASFHCLGLIYNLKHKNRLDCLIHAGAMGYDLHAVWKHARRLNEKEETWIGIQYR